MRIAALLFVVVAAVVIRPAHAQDARPAAAPLTFSLTYAPSVCDSYTGRVYLMFGAGPGEPRNGPSWFGPAPFFAVDVKDWKPDTPLIFDDKAIAYPGPLSTLEAREWSVQAVMRRNLDSPSIGGGAGDGYSTTLRRKLDGATSGAVDLRIDQTLIVQPLRETDRIKVVQMKSDMLSYFHARDITMRAIVILPKDYDKFTDRRYPALYWIGGFGSDASEAYYMASVWERTGFSDQIVRVVLDPSCLGGHHVFADSANNGPRGRALVEELIPELEKRFRLVAAPTARFLSGHSSGGWSSLWLQVAYPDVFGGVWSIAPDPVTFTDFQQIDLYKPGANMYVDEKGVKRPLARDGDRVLIWYEDFAKMEIPYGEGGQLRSFEWVFSPKGEDGLPAPLYDRQTGKVIPSTAQAWKKYDIRLIVEERWPTLAPKLAGKIHVHMGAVDTFYLEGATRQLKESLAKLDPPSDAVIEIVPDRDHGSIASPQLRKRIDQELLAVFVKNHPEYSTPSRAYD
ncbi:MAG TPA: alpha/beta hydrolase-fold protein [Phycisphaerales bacterium]|nr:alpha/beta hydrolase-fold protein [Phycisphaerales bacterium]